MKRKSTITILTILLIIFFHSTGISESWSIGYFVDDFGDSTGRAYLYQIINDGTFSNSATTNSRLSVIVLFTENEFRFTLYEYGLSRGMIADFFGGPVTLSFRNENGETISIQKRITSGSISYILFGSGTSEYGQLKNIFISSNEVRAVITEHYGSRYRFTIDTSLFNEDVASGNWVYFE